MSMSRTRFRDDRGATAIFVSVILLLLLGFAAIAIDLGAGFNERRQDQTAADLGVMAGSLESLNSVAAIRDETLNYVKLNLDTTVTAAEWQTAWEGCLDPERTTTYASLRFTPVPLPAGWSNATSNLPCISVSPYGYVRVNTPDQFVDTTFGQLMGVDQLQTGADAIAKIAARGRAGILPFGLTSTAAGGDHLCLSSAPTGLAVDPCVGPNSGNFGTLKAPFFGNPDLGTSVNCNAAPLGDTLAINIAIGIDHFVTVAPGTSGATEIRDICFNIGVNTLNTDTGFPNAGVEEGLAGPLPATAPAGALARLTNSSNTANRFGRQLDDKPLWEYIDPTLNGLTATDVPTICDPTTFDNSPTNPFRTHADFKADWNGDTFPDELESWQHMGACLKAYETTGPWEVLLLSTIEESPRFSYAPQFHENTLGMGNNWLHIQRFRAVFIQGTWWKKGNAYAIFHPGEGCVGTCASNYAMKQVSGFIVPDAALPLDLRGDPPPFGGLNPYEFQLWK
jgi:Putative Flp pilus-assembly TadE/G-like